MKKLKLLCITLLITSYSFAQEVVIKGVIVADSDPLPGVTILKKGTKISVQTDLDGNFSITAAKGDKLLISYLGFKTKEFKIKNKATPIITLTEDNTHCFPEIAFNLPFTVYEIGGDNLKSQEDIYNGIRAQVPGVLISNTNRFQTPIITMRGDANTIVIIDGVRYSDTSILQDIHPADIEKIYVANSVSASTYLRTYKN